KRERSMVLVLRQIAVNLVRNPLVIGLVAGMAMHLSGLAMPTTVATVVGQIAGMAVPAALISLGMALDIYRPSSTLLLP
ncbi:AEC family transporter, partial [Rhizobium ruizarguesonis]